MPKPTNAAHPTTPKPKVEMTIEDRYDNLRSSPTVQQDWYDKITDRPSSKFDQFTRDFLHTVDRYLKNGYPLTERMARQLERLYVQVG